MVKNGGAMRGEDSEREQTCRRQNGRRALTHHPIAEFQPEVAFSEMIGLNRTLLHQDPQASRTHDRLSMPYEYNRALAACRAICTLSAIALLNVWKQTLLSIMKLLHLKLHLSHTSPSRFSLPFNGF